MHHMILGWFEYMICLHGLAWAMALFYLFREGFSKGITGK